MKTLRIAALAVAVSGVFTLGAKAGTDTNNWWDVTFDDKLGLCDLENQTVGPDGAMVVLTNQFKQGDGATVSVQTWDSGIWYTQDGDETIVTNSYNPTNTYKAYGSDLCLKLDTQGNDLTWRVDPTNTMADSRTALVDADLYLVGSDSPPDTGDFDASHDVQTAVYLKNETDEDTGETTNSVLCVYVYDSDAEENYWQELKGVTLEDNSWASVKVVVDHAKVIDPQNDYPVVQVFVNGVKMTARDGDTDHWTAANFTTSKTAARVSSVAFRGTGAVDNFVGKLVETTFDSFTFTAEVYMNGNLVAQGTEGNVTRVEEDVEAGPGKVARFEDFLISDYDYDFEETEASWALSKVVVIDQGTGAETTYHYEWDGFNAVCLEGDNPALDIDTLTGPNGEYQTGLFDAIPSTAGATKDGLIIKIYFDDLPEEGTFNAKATTTIGEATTTDVRPVKPSEFDGGATKTITWEFPAVTNGNVLSTIQVYNGADLVDYADKTATVSVTLDAALLEHTLFAAATYVPGTLAEGQDLERTKNGDTYTFAPYTPPVAIIIAGNVTNKYDSLRGAITNATAGDTIYLVADDSVSFTADDPILDIDFEVTIDGGSNTLYGISDFAGEGYNEVRIGGSGNVTIKDLAFSEFGDTAPLSGASMPICTRSTYTGKLVLDGVTIDKFNRQALLLCGGEFLITNSVITGCAGEEGKTSYFQSAIETYYAKGDVGDTTITGIGALNAGGPTPDDEWAAAVFTVNPLAGADGSVKVTSGYYEGQFIVAFNPETTGTVTLEGGTFVATVAGTESAFLDDSEGGSTLAISGGWFDREPEAKYIANGLAAYEDAPGEEAPWTVRAAKVTIDFYVDGAVYATTSVVVGATGYAPADPEKVADEQYAYAFTGWTNVVGESYSAATLPAATTATNYYAAFSVVVRSYEVEWVVDGVYTTNTWNYDATPSWNENDPTAVPTKDSTEATNFTFKAWNPEVVAVTGFASYTATWTETARTYAITFQTNGVVYATVDAEWHATGYAPADPAAPDGFQFDGWTNAVAGGAVVAAADLPQVTGEATWTAVFSEVSSGHIGAKSEEGFVILAPTDPDYDDTKPLTFAAPDVTAGTVGISASMIPPDSGTEATLTLLYKTDLNAAAYSTVEVSVKNIDATAGTATMELPANFMDGKNTLFFFGFSNEAGVLDD